MVRFWQVEMGRRRHFRQQDRHEQMCRSGKLDVCQVGWREEAGTGPAREAWTGLRRGLVAKLIPWGPFAEPAASVRA